MKGTVGIIGAGPAGCYAAFLLANKGYDVNVFEEHNEIGEPVQCTGIVTSSIKDILEVPEGCIVNKIKKARIYSPDNNFTEVNFKEEDIILDRKRFDCYLAEMAVKAGAKIFLNSRFIGFDSKDNLASIQYKNKNVAKIKTDFLIGADGPCSEVAKFAGLLKKREYWTGMQARVKLKNEGMIEFYLSIGKFAWVVPENECIARVGILANKNLKKLLNDFINSKKIKKKDIISYQAGIIPVYDKKAKIQNGNIFLIGDAAAQVKATTAGGIVQGLTAAGCLAESIEKGKDYEKEVKKKIGKELWLHSKARKVMDNFSERDYCLLVKLFNKKRNNEILEKHSRDSLSKFFIRLIINEPRLLFFIKNLF